MSEEQSKEENFNAENAPAAEFRCYLLLMMRPAALPRSKSKSVYGSSFFPLIIKYYF